MRVYPFHIPTLPPSVNHIYGQSRRGGRFKVQAVLDFVQEAGLYLKRPKQPIAEPVRLSVIFKIRDKRRRDLDNLLKILCDTLVELLVIEDDSLIVKINATKKPGDTDGVFGLLEYGSLSEELVVRAPLVGEVERKRAARKQHKVGLR